MDRGSPPPGADVDDDFLFYLRQGTELVHQGRPDEGRIALERALGLRPDHTKALNLLALAYFKLGQLERARLVYAALAETYPHEPALFVNLGLVLLREGRLEEAERALRTALMMSPEHTRAHCYLGMVLYRRGELVQARDHFIRGDAVEFARRLEARIASGRGSWSAIRAVAEEGVDALSSDLPALRAIFTTPPPGGRTTRPIEAAGSDRPSAGRPEAWSARPGELRSSRPPDRSPDGPRPVPAHRAGPVTQDLVSDERPVHDDRGWESMTAHHGRVATGDLEASMLADAVPAPAGASDAFLGGRSSADSERPLRPSHDVPWRDSPMRGTHPGDGELRLLALDPMDPPSVRPLEVVPPVRTGSARPSISTISRRPSLLPAEPSGLEQQRLPPLPFVEPSLRLLGDLAWSPGFTAGRELGPSARLVVSGRALVRGSAIVAVAGDVRFAPVSRGDGGRSPLGGASDPLVVVAGEAKLMLKVWRVAVALRDARGLRVVEPALVGFEGDYAWSPIRTCGLDVVGLDGRGTVLLDSPGAPLVAPVSGASLVISREAVLAWTDGLTLEPGPAAGAAPLVQLSGTGHVFLAAAAAGEGLGG